jgi:ribonucleoside-diphosphate reductase alpha chain
MQDLSVKVLSDVIHFMKYSKFIPELNRRETWDETVQRNMDMHIKKFPALKKEIGAAFQFVFDKKVLPSMRSMQFGGKPIELNPARGYNCAFMHASEWEFFHELMFLLLGGSGVGYSVQRHHVVQLPEVKKPTKRKKRHLVGDSIEGWADAVKVLVKAYFFGESTPEFDYSDIRSKGSYLKTSGGRAPGPQPLKDCIHNLRKILDAKESGDKLSALEVHDMACFIADAVLSGGIRRAAMLALFSFDDEEMLTCKFGNWYELNPQRARANNSVCILRHKVKKKQFLELWQKIEASKSGEPGFVFSNNAEWGTNPCGEIALRTNQFCNLTTINVSNLESQEDLNQRAKAASFIGTLQASYTDFHYLRDVWKDTTEKEALIGVSQTGIASGEVLKYSLEEAANVAVEENTRAAKLLGIKRAARVTSLKPEGTGTLAIGAGSSGIHAWHSNYFIKAVRVNKNEPIYKYLVKKIPKLIEDDYFKPTTDAIINFPLKAPSGAILRNENVFDLLERVKKYSIEWIKPGHNKGDNMHNVSATISIKDNEWPSVGEWMWTNREVYTGLSVLPFDNHTYIQAPLQDCTKERYEELMKHAKGIDLSEIVEYTDGTELKESVACAGPGGSCEIV